MKNLKGVLLIFLSMLFSCSSTENISFKTTDVELSLNSIEYFVSLENKLQSKETTRDHFVGVGEGIYPYVKNHTFEIRREFVSYPQQSIELCKSYYFTNDNKVKLILYEWSESKTSTVSNKTFKKKFQKLEKNIKLKLGRESFKNIASDTIKSNKTCRDDVKWESSEINAYLFRFVDKKDRYNKIRLAVYKD